MFFTRNIFKSTRWQYYLVKVNKPMTCMIAWFSITNKGRFLTAVEKLMVFDKVWKKVWKAREHLRQKLLIQ
jgi:hypothetical protein